MKTIFGIISLLILTFLFANPVSPGHLADDTDTPDSTSQYITEFIDKDSGTATMLLLTTGVIGFLIVSRKNIRGK